MLLGLLAFIGIAPVLGASPSSALASPVLACREAQSGPVAEDPDYGRTYDASAVDAESLVVADDPVYRRVYSRTYDAFGRVVAAEFSIVLYDESEARPFEDRSDVIADNEVTVYEYDPHGRPEDRSDVIDDTEVLLFEYEPHGRLIRNPMEHDVESDNFLESTLRLPASVSQHRSRESRCNRSALPSIIERPHIVLPAAANHSSTSRQFFGETPRNRLSSATRIASLWPLRCPSHVVGPGIRGLATGFGVS